MLSQFLLLILTQFIGYCTRPPGQCELGAVMMVTLVFPLNLEIFLTFHY